MTTVNFKVEGKYITKRIRESALDPNISHAWNILKSLVPNEDFNKKDFVPLFKDILKGTKEFIGLNNLELIECENDNLVEQIEKNISRQNIEYNKERFHRLDLECPECNSLWREEHLENLNTNNLIAGEEIPLGVCQECKSNIYIKNKNERDFFNKENELENYSKIFELSDFDKNRIKLLDYNCKINNECGWIDENGFFFKVNYEGHQSFLTQLSQELFSEEFNVTEIEKRWIRVSSSLFFKGRILTSKQKGTLTKYIWANKAKIFDSTNSIHIHGFGQAELKDNGTISIKRNAYK
jgi:hypothetical protein